MKNIIIFGLTILISVFISVIVVKILDKEKVRPQINVPVNSPDGIGVDRLRKTCKIGDKVTFLEYNKRTNKLFVVESIISDMDRYYIYHNGFFGGTRYITKWKILKSLVEWNDTTNDTFNARRRK